MAAAQAQENSICPGGFINDQMKYRMNHRQRGIALMFIHTDFEPSLGLAKRGEDDIKYVQNCFGTLGFHIVVRKNLTINAIQNELNEVSSEDHTERDCLAVIVSTHGLQGVLYAKDGSYPQERLWAPFTAEKCRSLIGKPKLFFIQACRGVRCDDGVDLPVGKSKVFIQPQYNLDLEHGSHDGSSLFEVESDFLVAFATVSGYASWRKSGQGSVFIKKLCSEMTKKRNSEHLLSILTAVLRRVAIDFSSTTDEEETNEKKQIPCVTHRLMKLLYFNNAE